MKFPWYVCVITLAFLQALDGFPSIILLTRLDFSVPRKLLILAALPAALSELYLEAQDSFAATLKVNKIARRSQRANTRVLRRSQKLLLGLRRIVLAIAYTKR